MVLFYADVLGVKARWKTGRIDLVRSAYAEFEDLIRAALSESPPDEGVVGGVQSDAAALLFDAVPDAVRVGMSVFRSAFERAAADERLWIRGLIMPVEQDHGALIAETSLGAAWPEVGVRHFSPELLNAVNVEQAFKGPRLLVDQTLVDEQLREGFRIGAGERYVVPFRELEYAPLPTVGGRWCDVLYLLPNPLQQDRLTARSIEMSQRVRWAASEAHGGSPEELAQVSALAVVWAECEAIAWSVGLRAGLFDRRDPAPNESK
ncbi:MAG TPA: hypothetical protein VHY83_09975 [Solirubrobacteraceae bacterium]|jgi:hypothetical protein|nr:hypothetical protein [Solirubrobacteraceae bacterium]